jgi:hypothetical protein
LSSAFLAYRVLTLYMLIVKSPFTLQVSIFYICSSFLLNLSFAISFYVMSLNV